MQHSPPLRSEYRAQLKMIDFSDNTGTGISIWTQATLQKMLSFFNFQNVGTIIGRQQKWKLVSYFQIAKALNERNFFPRVFLFQNLVLVLPGLWVKNPDSRRWFWWRSRGTRTCREEGTTCKRQAFYATAPLETELLQLKVALILLLLPLGSGAEEKKTCPEKKCGLTPIKL